MKQTIIAATFATSVFALGFAVSESKNKAGEFSSKLAIDRSAPDRSGPFGGFSSIVDEVAPSVVSIATSRTVAQAGAGNQQLERFFNNPQFRDFFGGQMPQRQQRGPAPVQRGTGSGVILTPDGFILTNNHVVEGADEIRIRLSNDKEMDATVVATDPPSDLAVIKVDGTKLPAATVGDSEKLKQGDFVLAIGSPFGLSHTVTSGIVSATGRDNLNITGYENFIQTDASINPGNSGGALIDNKGRLVGINTAILSRSGGNVGIGFAIPINMAINIAEQLIDNGEIKRGYLGVSLAPLDRDLAEALGLDTEASGVVVNEVVADTPAAEAGFEAGDVITAVNGKAITDTADVRRLVSREAPGTTLEFAVRRDSKNLTLSATIAELPGDLLAGGPSRSSATTPDSGALAGVRLGRLDEQTRQRLSLDEKVEGVVVLELDPNSKAASAGLKPGHVITEVNREPVSTPREAYAQAKDRQERATLLRVLDGETKRFLAIS